MKKLFIFSILLMLLLVSAFAQDEEKSGWTVSGGAQVYADLMYFTKGSGKLTITGVDDTVFGKELGGSFNIMSSSLSRAPGIQTDLVIGNAREGDKFSYALSLQMIFAAGFARGEGIFKDGGGDYSFTKFLDNFKIGDWFITGTAGMFEGYLGNTGYGGVVPVYGDFNDFINFKLDGFYVNVLGDRLGTNKMNLWSGGASFALGVNFLKDTLRFAIGTDVGEAFTGYDRPYASANSINMGAIFSIHSLADILSLDLFYGINGKDGNTNISSGASWDNRFGVYAGLDFIDWLGLTVGYSAAVTVNEKYNEYDTANNKWISYKIKNPLYSAVHVHMNMDIGKFDIIFNNNLSFAGRKGKDYTEGDNVNMPLVGNIPLIKDASQSWFGWDAGLAVNFKATDSLNLCLQLVNQLGTFGRKGNIASIAYEEKYTANIFFVGLNAEYKIGPVTFGAGLQLETASLISKGTIAGIETKSKKSETSFGIPLFFKVEF